jgi:hypothetical protein
METSRFDKLQMLIKQPGYEQAVRFICSQTEYAYVDFVYRNTGFGIQVVRHWIFSEGQRPADCEDLILNEVEEVSASTFTFQDQKFRGIRVGLRQQEE